MKANLISSLAADRELCHRSRTSGHERSVQLAATSLAGLNRRTRHCPIGTVNAAVACLWFKYDVAVLAFIEPLTCICRHGFSLCMPACRTSYCRFKNYSGFLRLHKAYRVIVRKIASAGSRTKSRYPIAAVSPIPLSNITRAGVEQQTAVTNRAENPNELCGARMVGLRSCSSLVLTFVLCAMARS